MNAPARNPEMPPERDGPTLFNGLQLEVDEIMICCNRVNDACAELRIGITERYEQAVKQAADEIGKAAAQMSTMAMHLAGLIAKHQARKPRA